MNTYDRSICSLMMQLPGRTDNEIKNYWNTRMKRRQKANLPLYPEGVRKTTNMHQRRHQQRHPQQHSPLSSLLHSQQVSSYLQGRYGFDPSPYHFYPAAGFSIPPINNLHSPPFTVHSEPNHNHFPLNSTNGNFFIPIPSASSFLDQSSSAGLLQNPPNSLHTNSPGIFDGQLTGPSAMMMGASVEDSAGNGSGTNNELPSSQHQSVMPTLTPSSSSVNSGDCFVGDPSCNYNPSEYYDIEQPLKHQNSGLLDSLLQESKGISSEKNFKDENNSSVARSPGKQAVEENQSQSFIGMQAFFSSIGAF